MQDYKAYIEELRTLKIELKEFYLLNGRIWDFNITPAKVPDLNMVKSKCLWLGHYDQSKSNYEAILKGLQQKALSDVLMSGTETAKLLLFQLIQVEEGFSRLQEQMRDIRRKFREDELIHVDLQQYVYPYFIINIKDQNKWGTITQEFMNDFEDALMFKSSNVGGAIKQLEEVLGIKVETEEVDNDVLTQSERINNEYYKQLIGRDMPSSVYLKSFRKLEIATREVADNYNRMVNEQAIKEGDDWYSYTDPQTFEEHWERFVKYDSQQFCERLQVQFVEMWGGIKTDIVRRRISELDKFISSTESTGIGKALGLSNNTKPDFKDAKEEYLRLVNGYYNSHSFDERIVFACKIYSEYVLFKNWLEKQLEHLQEKHSDGTIVSQSSEINKEQVKDYEYELSIADFGYKKIITDSTDFKDALFEEFVRLVGSVI